MRKWKRFQDRSIRQKLFLTYSILMIVPLVVISIYFYTYAMSIFESRIVKSFQETNQQMVSTADSFVSSMIKSSEQPFYDEKLMQILSKDYSTVPYETFEKSMDYRYISDSMFKDLMTFNPSIDSILIYPVNSPLIYRRGYDTTFNYKYSPVNELWYRKIVNNAEKPVLIGMHEEKQMYAKPRPVLSVGRVLVDVDTYQKLGVLLVNFRVEQLESLFSGLTDKQDVNQFIVDEEGTVVFSATPAMIGADLNQFIAEIEPGNKNYYVVHHVSEVSGWEFYSIIHRNKLFAEINRIRNFAVLLIVLLVVLGFVTAFLVSGSISNPIRRLNRLMRKVERGDFNVTARQDSLDEVGHLSTSFNRMTAEIKELIEQIKLEEKKKRGAELNALQNQINPHFIYNTLSVIKWMAQAQMADNITEAIDDMIHVLSFSTRNTQEFVSIEEEMAFIHNYLELLQLRYYNVFDFEMEVAPDVLRCRTLKFMVQPFVENAVFHAFAGDDRHHYLNIHVERADGDIRFTISDNGCGIAQERLDELLQQEMSNEQTMNSIGIGNVSRRLKLHFGQKYGVSMDSHQGEGTTVRILIPALEHHLGHDQVRKEGAV
ncbi:two-component system sensor histidine kinase YesM [Fontibacillus phaseoli]|uniref:histidine kinase n=1 Tax=Fontibacillus phaseoli TaxID=1416533 RepID=A0A369BGC0_9BACL|nr:sensor histidine kinase [Fontibacillus phaseoli]RCX19616.1 two-component system sensor histidine kinase YesM [Fontibacillus phaseoli]